MTASKLSRGLIVFDGRHHRADCPRGTFAFWNPCARIAATCSSCFDTLCYSFSLKRILAGRSLCRFRAERRKVAHGFSSWFARQKNLLSSSAERGLRRKDSFFGGWLRQAKRTFRRATSNAEKTLLYVKSEAEEKAVRLNSSRLRYPLFHFHEKWRSEMYTYVLRTVWTKKDSLVSRRLFGFNLILNRSSSDGEIDLIHTILFTQLAYIYFDLQ